MKKLILIFSLILGITAFSQNNEQKVNNLIDTFTDGLESNGINTYFYTKRYCLGETRIFTSNDGSMCVSNGTYYEAYIFWLDGEQLQMKKIDNCGLYNAIAPENNSVYKVFAENIDELKSGLVKGYEVEYPENMPTQRTEIHSCMRYFHFRYGMDEFEQSYRLFDLTNDSKYKNVNYADNNSLKIVELDKKIDELVNKYGDRFKRN